jgi:hypothetical protein
LSRAIIRADTLLDQQLHIAGKLLHLNLTGGAVAAGVTRP